MRDLTIELENMHCGACVRRVSQLLNSLPLTHADEVRIGMARVHTEQPESELCAALASAGFPARIGQAGA